MTSIDINAIESITVVRQDNEDADLLVTIEGEDGTTITACLGQFLEDAIDFRDLLLATAKAITDEIIDNWQDVPNDDFDAFVYEGRDGYLIHCEGVGKVNGPVKAFLSREVAEYELAKLMVEQGCFPNAWFVNERGNYFEIHEAIRKYHDEGGDKLLPLEGIEYGAGDEIVVKARVQTGPFSWDTYYVSGEIIEDYGNIGIVFTTSVGYREQFTDDRSDVKPWEEDAEDQSEELGSRLIFDERFGQVSVNQSVAYKECNISPSDHDALVQKFGAGNRDAIITAARERVR